MSEALLKVAKKRFTRAQEWESQARINFINDLKFAHGDAYNMFQWPQTVIDDRRVQERPCLTTNIVRQHNLSVKNDAAQNKPGMRFRAVGDGASKEAADIWADIARSIEYHSNFGAVVDRATEFQVDAGIGYWRVVTEYEDEDTFDQVIRIRPINDPRSVYLDPDAQEADKSDAKFGFIFVDMPKEEFELKYPRYAGMALTQSSFGEEYSWVKKDSVRVAEYFYIEYQEDQLLLIPDDNDPTLNVTVRRSQLTKDAFKFLRADAAVKVRPIQVPQVKWALIAGNAVVEKKDWDGKYIPIVPVIGTEIVLDGVMDRLGHTRTMLDAQRMYNYWNSAAVEFVALQTKTPWVAAVEAISGFEDAWDNANVENLSVLNYNAFDENGQPIPPPKRTDPPAQSQGYVQGAMMARQEMMMASGQYENQMGQQGNERTGKAISERQRQGDRATYHFINNLGRAIRFTALIIYDLVPKVYDTFRVMQLTGENGLDYEVQLDPNAAQAYQKKQGKLQEGLSVIFNPNKGKYAVYADLGPGYATKREEAWNAFNNILTQAPDLVPIIGDLLMLAGDFPHSQEAADRLRRMVPKAALGEGPTPGEQQLQAQLQELQQQMAQLTEENATLRIAAKSKEDTNLVGMYGKQTERLKTLAENLAIPPEVLVGMLAELVQDQLRVKMEEIAVTQAQRAMLPAGPNVPDAATAAGASMPGMMNPLASAFRQGLRPPLGGALPPPPGGAPAPGGLHNAA